MYTTNVAEKIESKPENVEIKMPEEKSIDKKLDNRQNLLIMTLASLLIMFTAVGLIYYNIRTNPEIVHENDQTSEVTTNEGFVNPNSMQQLENDTSNITMKPAENSEIFIACGVVFMIVMAGAFVFVKVAEHKEDN